MERLNNLSEINTDTIEGKLLIAALSEMSCIIYPETEPDEILHILQDKVPLIYNEVKECG